MILRQLKKEDAPLMYEWMTAKDVNLYFRFDPSKVTIASCEEFIENSFNDCNRTYAIDVDGEYAGSISLKHINQNDRNAEMAISIRSKFRGKGLGKQAIKKILEIGFSELNLNKIYLDVLSDNEGAIKIGNQFKSLKLYGIWRSNYEELCKRN